MNGRSPSAPPGTSLAVPLYDPSVRPGHFPVSRRRPTLLTGCGEFIRPAVPILRRISTNNPSPPLTPASTPYLRTRITADERGDLACRAPNPRLSASIRVPYQELSCTVVRRLLPFALARRSPNAAEGRSGRELGGRATVPLCFPIGAYNLSPATCHLPLAVICHFPPTRI
jgi:hypothetical protein